MFTDLPRYFGIPSQIYVTNKLALENFLKMFNGKTPCFISTYRFPEPEKPVVDMAVFDIDSKVSLTLPYKDIKKLKKWCDKNDLKYVIDFSGGKGFHFFLLFKPIEGTQEIKDKLYSLQYSLINYLDINSIDLPTIGRLRWLIRMPTTQYVRYERKKKKVKKIKNGNFCRTISPNDFDKGLDYILKLAKEPGELPKRPSVKYSIDDIINLIPNYKLQHRYNSNDYLEFLNREGILTPTIDAVGLPCLKRIAQDSHPCHQARIELVAWLKVMGYRDIAINAFIKSLKWRDYNYKITAANVASIKPRFPKCSWLREQYPDICKDCSLKRR